MSEISPQDTSTGEPTSQDESEITYHFIKSNYFRVIHCDGVIGGPSPGAELIEVAVFNERIPIPLQTVHRFEDGRINPIPASQVGRKGVVREVECNIIMSIEAAELVAKWLNEAVQKVRNAPK